MPVYVPSNHFDDRVRDRFNIEITPEIVEEITLRICNGLFKGRRKSKRTSGVYIYELYVGGRLRGLLNNYGKDTVGVVFDNNNKMLVTVYEI